MNTQSYTFFIGIDISKPWFDASITADGLKPAMKHRRFDNNKTGFDLFLKWIRAQLNRRKLNQLCLFCMEHTGVYTLPICNFLQKKQLSFVLVSGLQINLSLGIQRGKDDKEDSKRIAKFAFEKHKQLNVSTLPTDDLMTLRNLLAYRARLVKYKKGLFVAAKELHAFVPPKQAKAVVQDSNNIVEIMNQRIKWVEKQMLQIINHNDDLAPLYQLLISVKSIGIIVASTLLVYTVGFTAFDNVRKFACYCSIAPFGEQSGTSIHKDKAVHSLGYRKIKVLLTNAAQSAVNHDKELRAYFLRKVAEGKHEGSVLNAVKFKILARAFAVVKRGTPWVERETFRA